MSRTLRSVLSLVALWLLALGPGPATADPGPEASEGPATLVDGDVAIEAALGRAFPDDRVGFRRGDWLLDGPSIVADTVLGANGALRLDAPVDGNATIFALGAEVRRGVGGSLTMLGLFQTVLNAPVRGDATLVSAGSAVVTPEARVQGSLIIQAGAIDLRGGVGGSAFLAGDTVTVAGTVEGDLVIDGTDVMFLRGEGGPVRVLGDLFVRGTIHAPENVEVGGRTERLPAVDRTELPSGLLLAVLLLAGVLAWRAPETLLRMGEGLLRQPLRSAGVGLATGLALAAGGFVLVVLEIGLPFGALALGVLTFGLFAAPVIVAAAAGERIFAEVTQRAGRAPLRPTRTGLFLRTAIPLTALVLLAQVPVLGPIVALLVIALGLGAAVRDLRALTRGFGSGPGPQPLRREA